MTVVARVSSRFTRLLAMLDRDKRTRGQCVEIRRSAQHFECEPATASVSEDGKVVVE
jgi:hypothetical protein